MVVRMGHCGAENRAQNLQWWLSVKAYTGGFSWPQDRGWVVSGMQKSTCKGTEPCARPPVGQGGSQQRHASEWPLQIPEYSGGDSNCWDTEVPGHSCKIQSHSFFLICSRFAYLAFHPLPACSAVSSSRCTAVHTPCARARARHLARGRDSGLPGLLSAKETSWPPLQPCSLFSGSPGHVPAVWWENRA